MNGSCDNAANARKICAGLTCWVVTDGKAGDEAPCLGLAAAMGLSPERRVIRPRALFAMLAPRGPIDPAERPNAPGSPIAPPFPDVLIASGRRAVPYLRHVRRASAGRTFTIFLKDPRIGADVADVVWVPAHDSLRGANVIVSIAAPHPVSEQALRDAREKPDPRIAALPRPRAALLIGGNSRHHRFEQVDRQVMSSSVTTMIAHGYSVMVTPSRRTPPELMEDLRAAAADASRRAFVWNGAGENPYLQMLAHADLILVTADSTNMVGEAVATSAPVFVHEPTGGHHRLSTFLDSLEKSGRVRRWRARPETWPCAPVDATQTIARDIAARYEVWRKDI